MERDQARQESIWLNHRQAVAASGQLQQEYGRAALAKE